MSETRESPLCDLQKFTLWNISNISQLFIYLSIYLKSNSLSSNLQVWISHYTVRLCLHTRNAYVLGNLLMHFFFFPNSSQISHHNSEKVLGVLVVVFVFVAGFFFFSLFLFNGYSKICSILTANWKRNNKRESRKSSRTDGQKKT